MYEILDKRTPLLPHKGEGWIPNQVGNDGGENCGISKEIYYSVPPRPALQGKEWLTPLLDTPLVVGGDVWLLLAILYEILMPYVLTRERRAVIIVSIKNDNN